MRKILAYVGDRLKIAKLPGGKSSDTIFIATPHKLITVENVVCRREGADLRLGFSIRNLGTEIRCFGLKLINNFDHEGREYDYSMSFGKTSCDDGSMLHYTLPEDIPIKVLVTFYNTDGKIGRLAQVKFSGICIRNRRNNKKYNPSGILLLRNIPVSDLHKENNRD